MQPDPSNKYFDMAVQYVNYTAQHLFLTGKAGTGKTTFLKHIKENSTKKLAILAPTGVAAINAGGSTIHSFFQLPFGSFLPAQQDFPDSSGGNFYSRHSLLRRLRLGGSKRRLMQELELLIIDEISMVRADLLDAIDVVLRHIRKQPYLPFGGVQMLYIGDLSQLPPVVKEQEWSVLQNFYRGPFFFHAMALQEAPPLYLELKKIYRQSDSAFIHILNNIRKNQVQAEDIQFLNQFYRPDFKPETKGEYITLTSHNAKADIINQEELKKLPGRIHTFDAEIEGDFNESSYPADPHLQLKEGAQIMFIRNDKGEFRRFYNGKIGTISRINRKEIYVEFPNERGELLVEKESWKNLRYNFNKEKDQIEEEEMGSFTQYPIRLAWAITIHKSQGLTFDKAIIDAGRSFAAGQVYVALSRLTSLDGLVLHSKIDPSSIKCDKEAEAFSDNELQAEILQEQLIQCQRLYLHQVLLQAFNWKKLNEQLETFSGELEDRRIPLKKEAEALIADIIRKVKEQALTAEKFSRQLEQMLQSSKQSGYTRVHERVTAAADYFSSQLEESCIKPLKAHKEAVKKTSKAKKYQRAIQNIIDEFPLKELQLRQAITLTEGLLQGTDPSLLLSKKQAPPAPDSADKEEDGREKSGADLKKAKSNGQKPAKGNSKRTSLELFRQGLDIEAIAEERGLAPSTIEGHLLSFIPTGEMELHELVPEGRVHTIEEAIDSLEAEEVTSSMVKEIMSDDFSYTEIKAVLYHRKKVQTEVEDQK